MRRILLLSILVCLGNQLSAQQAWTQKKGEGYFQLGGTFYTYSSAYADDFSSVSLQSSVTEIIASFYGEYGISDKITLSLNLPFHFITGKEIEISDIPINPVAAGSLNALGNINGMFTYQFYKHKAWVMSAKFGLTAYSSRHDSDTGLRSGSAGWGFSPSFLAGVGTSKIFASTETGFNFRTHGLLHQFVLNAQIGKEFLKSKRLLLIFGVVTTTPMGDTSFLDQLVLDQNARHTYLYLNEQAYYAINLKVGYKFTDNWSAWLSMGGGPGRNIGQGAVYNLSIGYGLKK